MSRIAATTSGRPWSCSGLSAISTIDLAAVLAPGDELHLLAHRPRPRARGHRPRGRPRGAGGCASGTSASTSQADQLVDRVAEQRRRRRIGEHDRAARRRRRSAHRDRPRTGVRKTSRLVDAVRQRGRAWRGGVMPRQRTRHRRDEDVAGAAHRLDDLRIVGVGLELLAQPADLDVDRPVERRRPRGRASARAGSRATARGRDAATNAHSRSNSPLVSATSLPSGSARRRAATSSCQPAKR